MLTIDLDSPVPLCDQVVRGLRHAIAHREIAVGARLPSVRQLAGDLAVNLNTVARAYRRLEDDGLLRVRHGQGAVVVSDRVEGSETDDAAGALEASLGAAFADARLRGMTAAGVRRAAERALRKFEESAASPRVKEVRP